VGIDFLLERRVPADELRGALAGVLGVSDVEVVGAVEELTGDRRAQAVMFDVAGDFAVNVSLDPEGDLETVRALARALGLRALTGGDAVDPFTWILVHPDGRDERVSLDPDALDEEVYRLYKP
jgi:hypothetical protein